MQELNLAYKYPIIYWNTANLIVDSGSLEAGNNESTDYGKIATSIATMKKEGIDIALPLINEAEFSFVPDVKNNRIIYSLKALCGLGDSDAQDVIDKQPYNSFEDFLDRTALKNKAIIALIKAGAFTELDNADTKKTMKKFIYKKLFTRCEKLTFSQFNQLEQMNMVPEELQEIVKIKNFKSYVLDNYFFYKNVINKDKKVPKVGYHDRLFIMDEQAMKFFTEHFSEERIVVGIKGDNYVISEKEFTKEWKKQIQPLADWFQKEDVLELFNQMKFKELWNKYAAGTKAKWEMDALSFYYTEHELAHLDTEYYGLVDFSKLPEEPEPYDYYVRYISGERKEIPKNKIERIAGTVINKNNDKHLVTLLTTDGVVNVKMGKGQYSFYNRRISKDGSVVDDGWFKRGTKLFICGYRRDSQFFAYRYKDTIYQHTVMKITDLYDDGKAEIMTERIKV